MLVLHILTTGDKYGYEISQMISDLSDGLIQVPGGSLYPSLYKLEEKGCVSEEKRLVGKRKMRAYYHIEDKGEEYLKELLKDYEDTSRGIMMILKSINDIKDK